MSRKEGALLFLLGMAIWVVGTIYYAYFGPRILETSEVRYWVSFFVSPIISAAICIWILRRRRIPASNWANAILLLAIPGMIGEALVLSHLSTFMPRLRADSGGKYGAYLFATYGLVLGMAEMVTLRAKQSPATADD